MISNLKILSTLFEIILIVRVCSSELMKSYGEFNSTTQNKDLYIGFLAEFMNSKVRTLRKCTFTLL